MGDPSGDPVRRSWAAAAPLALSLALWLVLCASAAAAPPPSPAAPETVVADAAFPTNMAFAPDGRLFYVEKDTGNVRVVENGHLLEQPFAHFDVTPSGETGLLGIAIPPDFAADPWVYLYMSDAKTGNNEIVRVRANGNAGGEVQPILTALPTVNGYHNGGDIAFGPDRMLYVTVGEIHESARAQNPRDLGGKILRITPGGASPEDNPFGQTPVYSMGHRNSFGICFDPASGAMYETENGPDSHDEVNKIQAGGNYGWPTVMGPSGNAAFVDPIWDFPKVVVPTGCAVANHTLYWGDYSEGRIYSLSLDPAGDPQAVVVADLGVGITDLEIGPDGGLYVSTANSIVRFASPPVGALAAAAAGGSSGPVAIKSDHFETYAAWVAGLLALALAIGGGLWFRRISRRENARPDA